MKYFNFKRNKFSTILKNINLYKLNLQRIYKQIYFKSVSFFRFYKYLNLKRYNFFKIFKYFDYRDYIDFKVFKRNIIKINKYLLVYLFGVITLVFLIYFTIPVFYEFEKAKIKNVICKDLNFECEIKGKVNYTFFPSPRIKVKKLEIKDIVNSKNSFAKIENTAITISLYNLFDKEKIKFKRIYFSNAEINLNLKNLNNYKKFLLKRNITKKINLKNSRIIFFEKNETITSISNVSFVYKTDDNLEKIVLKGDFLDDKILFILKNNKKDEVLKSTFEIKLPGLNFFSKGKILHPNQINNITNGNILIKNLKNRITAFFDFKNNQIIFKKANIRTSFLDGKFSGKLSFLPYFNFDLNIELSSLNFNRLNGHIIALDKKNPKKLFKINNKINGILNLSSENVFSKNTLVDSFESKLRFINGDILFEQFLINLKKIGAADFTGVIKNDNKFTNFKFESNIFIDNLKKFYSKFGIYNRDKEKKPSDLFISGNVDLVNLVLRLNEVVSDTKLNEKDISYIEKEFNQILLEDRYESFFNFDKLKEFVKLAVDENN